MIACTRREDANELGLQTREKKQSKLEQSGLSEEELLKQQQELFRSATDKYNQAPQDAA